MAEKRKDRLLNPLGPGARPSGPGTMGPKPSGPGTMGSKPLKPKPSGMPSGEFATPGGPTSTTPSGGGYAEWTDENGEHHRVYIPPSGGGLPVYTEGSRKGTTIGQEDIPMEATPGGGIVGSGHQPSGAPEMTPGEVQDVQSLQGMAAGARPPEGYQVPDYGPAGRESFENTVFEQIGMNPHTYNIHEELEKATQEAIPQLFDTAFQGRIYYRDVDKLDKDEHAYWQNALKGFRAHVFQQLKAKQESAMDEYTWSMNKWDAVAHEKKAIEERHRKERGIEAKAAAEGQMNVNQGANLVAKHFRIEPGIIPEPDTQETYDLAMRDYQTRIAQGIDPLRASTESNTFAANSVKLYWKTLKALKGDKKKMSEWNRQFEEAYGFVPTVPKR